jgi:hypothetical protein
LELFLEIRDAVLERGDFFFHRGSSLLNEVGISKKKGLVARDYPDFYFLFIDGSQDCPNFRYASINRYWDYPDFYFLFIDGSQDCPNFRYASINRYWDQGLVLVLFLSPEGRGTSPKSLNHRIMFMLHRGEFCNYRKKSGKKDQAFRIKKMESENDQVENQAYDHRQRTAGDQFMPLGLCHGPPPMALKSLSKIGTTLIFIFFF